MAKCSYPTLITPSTADPTAPPNHTVPHSSLCTAFFANPRSIRPLKPAIPGGGTPSLPYWLPLLSHRFVCFPFSRPSPVNPLITRFILPFVSRHLGEEWGLLAPSKIHTWRFRKKRVLCLGFLGVCRCFFLEDLYQSEFLKLGGSWR